MTTWALPQPSEHLKLRETVDLRATVDLVGEGTVSIIRSAGIVDDEIARHRRIRIVVVGARYRQPQIGGEIPFQIQLGEERAQCFTGRQAGLGADAVRKRARQAFKRRREIARLIHAAHQAPGLLGRLALEAQGRRIERASPHGFDEIGRPEVARFALVAPRRRRGDAEQHAGEAGGDQAAARRRRHAGAEHGRLPDTPVRRNAVDVCRNGQGSQSQKFQTLYYHHQRSPCQAVPSRRRAKYA